MAPWSPGTTMFTDTLTSPWITKISNRLQPLCGWLGQRANTCGDEESGVCSEGMILMKWSSGYKYTPTNPSTQVSLCVKLPSFSKPGTTWYTEHADNWANTQVSPTTKNTNFSSDGWSLGQTIKPTQTRIHTNKHIHTYKYTTVCFESVDGVGLETVQCAEHSSSSEGLLSFSLSVRPL